MAAAALVYANSVPGPFLFDDQNSILANRQIRQLLPLSEPLSPPRDTPVAGRPVVNLVFALNYAFDGLDVTGYHVVNIAIHLLASLTLFGVIRRTPGASLNFAFACALIWMLHPLQTEPVNYLTQRTESLMGLFYLLTLYCAIRGWTVGAVLACAAGMASKESMVTAPLVVALYDRSFLFDSWRAAFRVRRRLYAGLAATWGVLAALMSTTPRTTVGFDGQTTWWVYLLNQFELIVRYLWLTVWPRELVLDYGLPRPLSVGDVLPEAVLVIALGMATVIALFRWPRLGFLAAWFFITLAPTSSIVPIQTEVGAERRMYLPLAGLVVLASLAGYRLIPHKKVAYGLAIVVCALLATGTLLRNREYQSRLSIAQTIVARWPSGRGHFLLGNELLEAGRRDAAIVQFRESARDYPGAHFALGTELMVDGRFDEAAAELEAFLRLQPQHANALAARDLLGRAYLATGRLDDAAREFEAVLREPRYPLHGQVLGMVDRIRTMKKD